MSWVAIDFDILNMQYFMLIHIDKVQIFFGYWASFMAH
jgi:hypothetical protein